MTTINETVTSTMRARGYDSYMSYAAPVVTALVDREHQICGHLIRFGQTKGLSENEVREALRECGMEVPVPQPAQSAQAAPAESNDLATVLSRIENTLSGLTQFARDNGYTG